MCPWRRCVLFSRVCVCVCVAHHVQVLASPIVKRFHVILQLLLVPQSNLGGQGAKLVSWEHHRHQQAALCLFCFVLPLALSPPAGRTGTESSHLCPFPTTLSLLFLCCFHPHCLCYALSLFPASLGSFLFSLSLSLSLDLSLSLSTSLDLSRPLSLPLSLSLPLPLSLKKPQTHTQTPTHKHTAAIQ